MQRTNPSSPRKLWCNEQKLRRVGEAASSAVDIAKMETVSAMTRIIQHLSEGKSKVR
jgi:hypothetical protein